MQRISFFLYGAFSHLLFLGLYAYMCAFVGNMVVPKTINAPAGSDPAAAMLINVLLLVGFGLQHSIMARPAFKRWWTRFVPHPIERSTYVLLSCVAMIALLWLWQPMTAVVWDVPHPALRVGLWALFATGWLLVPAASLLINHFDLFGTRQVWLHLRGQAYTHLPFRTPLLYRRVRHPLYVGWLIAFWAIPTMTAGHLLFATMMTGYILVAVRFEERDLVDLHGRQYAEYRRRVPMLIPRPGRSAGAMQPTDLAQAGALSQ